MDSFIRVIFQRKTDAGTEPETPEESIARLEAENITLRTDRSKLTTEREILCQTAESFAGEGTGGPLPVRCRPP